MELPYAIQTFCKLLDMRKLTEYRISGTKYYAVYQDGICIFYGPSKIHAELLLLGIDPDMH